MLGPVLVPEHAQETWQGQVLRALKGDALEPRSWRCVDVRDVALLMCRLAAEDGLALLLVAERCSTQSLLARLHRGTEDAPEPRAEAPEPSAEAWLAQEQRQAAEWFACRSFDDTLRDTSAALAEFAEL